MHDDVSLLTGLARAENSDPGFTHPPGWTNHDLHRVLTGLLVLRPGGILDPIMPPRAVFSAEEAVHLTPALQEAFAAAGPSDWIVFAQWGSNKETEALEVTSGGMFFRNGKLHFLLANHRERVSSENTGITGVRRNPLLALRDLNKGKLSFDPGRYVIDSRENWLAGGHDAPASELVLDFEGFLSATRPPSESGKIKQPSNNHDLSTGTNPEPAPNQEIRELKEEILELKNEISGMKNVIQQQKGQPHPPTR